MPDNWPVMVSIGKISQRQRNYQGALQWFERAFPLSDEDSVVIGEIAYTAAKIGDADKAVHSHLVAIEKCPHEYKLYANLALALLISGKIQEAQEKAEFAVEQEPDNEISRTVLSIIKEVANGQTPCPRNTIEIEGF